MVRRRVFESSRITAVAAYAAIAVAAPGCDAGNAAPAGSDPDTVVQAATTACTTAGSGAWTNQTFREQDGDFLAEFDATPSAGSIDAVVGFGDHAASTFSDLAAIVRFNPDGMIDARDGSTYRAGRPFPYQAGKRYHVRLVVFLHDHAYGVLIRNGDSADDSYSDLGLIFAFRTEQAGITRMTNVASEVDSPSGTLDICGVAVAPRPPPSPGCAVVNAGEGLVSFQISPFHVFDVVTFTMQPSTSNIDAVVGLSSGIPTGFDDLATAVRFSPDGVLDARDGDTYRADVPQPYDLRPVSVRMIADLTSHTYSVFAGVVRASGGIDPFELAHQYTFRTQQRGVNHLEFLSAIVDGPQGSVTICGIENPSSNNIAYSREGHRTVAPLPNDEALLSDGTTTTHVDASGQVLASVARGGELAADAAGNVFIANLANGTFTIDSYDPALHLRWGVAMVGAFQAGSSIAAIGTTAAGAALVAVGALQSGIRTLDVWRFTQAGPVAVLRGITGDAAGFDGDNTIVAVSAGSIVRITRYDATGAPTLTREFTGAATLTAVAATAGHDIVFGGALSTDIDFGGGVLVAGHPSENPETNAFVVELSSTGAHIFSRKTGGSVIAGIATGDQRIAVSDTLLTQFSRERLFELAGDGTPISTGLATGLGEFGRAGRVVMGPTGRIWWNLDTYWPRFNQWPYLLVVEE